MKSLSSNKYDNYMYYTIPDSNLYIERFILELNEESLKSIDTTRNVLTLIMSANYKSKISSLFPYGERFLDMEKFRNSEKQKFIDSIKAIFQ